MSKVNYVRDVSDWEDWQQDYRLGVIMILPPPDIAGPIDTLRAKYDPKSFAICTTHISLSDPLSKEMTDSLRQELKEIIRVIPEFELRFDKPHASLKHPGVYYPITPQAPIDTIKTALHQSSAFPSVAHERRHIPAHMTIAEFLSIDEIQQVCNAIQDLAPSGRFLCRELAYLIPDERFRFSKVEAFPLRGPDS